MMDGLKFRISKGGIPVIRLHYSADPNKRPGTPEGDRWIELEASGYPGGIQGPRWRKEMEIDYGAIGGMKVFPLMDQWITQGRIIIPPFYPEGCKLYGSYDHGWRNPSAYYVHAINYDGQIRTVWEFYSAKVTVGEIARIINGQDVVTGDGRRFLGNPFAGQEVFKVADPQIWAEDQSMSDNTMKSVNHLFETADPPVYFEPGDRGADTTVVEWILGHFWADPENPKWQITTDCPKLIWELGKLRHKEFSAKVALSRDQPEQLVDKDNHAWDSIKMFLKKFPPTPQELKEASKPATFSWWRKQAINAREGILPSTYRREMAG